MRLSRTQDEGSASVEFLGAGVLLLVPLVYLMLCLAQLQGAAFAVEGASRSAALAAARAPDAVTGAARAEAAIAVALADFGVDAGTMHAAVACDPDCGSVGALVRASVSVDVPLPFLPEVRVLPIEATAVVPVPRFPPGER
ncbi:MAG TPA: hypothetical protein VIL55_05850 [Naasia sp.]|jgi:hypothetical protein